MCCELDAVCPMTESASITSLGTPASLMAHNSKRVHGFSFSTNFYFVPGTVQGSLVSILPSGEPHFGFAKSVLQLSFSQQQ